MEISFTNFFRMATSPAVGRTVGKIGLFKYVLMGVAAFGLLKTGIKTFWQMLLPSAATDIQHSAGAGFFESATEGVKNGIASLSTGADEDLEDYGDDFGAYET